MPKRYSVTIEIHRSYTTEVDAIDEDEARCLANAEAAGLIADGEMDFTRDTEDISEVEPEPYCPPHERD
jgi:hypothetical protein